MKPLLLSLLVLLAGTRILAAAEESYFFIYKKGEAGPELRLEEDRLHTVHPIQRIDPPKAKQIFARHQGLGKGREYQIQVDLEGTLEERWFPMLKLGDDIITRGISVSYSNDKKQPSSFSIEHDDPETIRRWCRLLGPLLKLPEDQIDLDLEETEKPDVGGDAVAKARLSLDTRWRLNGASEWTLEEGPTVSLMESETQRFSFYDAEGTVLFRLEDRERVREVAVSPQRAVLLFKIDHEDGFGGCLLRVSMRGKEPAFERVLAHPATPLFQGKRWWISDLGAVSDDGDVVLAKIGWMPQTTGRVAYEWQTWSISRKERLGSGLQVGHGEIQAVKGK